MKKTLYFCSLFLFLTPLLRAEDEGMSLVEQKLLSSDGATVAEGVKLFSTLKDREKNDAIETLLGALATSPTMAMRAAPGLGSLTSYAPKTAPYLVEALRYDDEEVYLEVAKALQKLGPAATLPTLIRSFDDANFFVRRRSAEIVGRFGRNAQAAVPGLFDLWQDQTYEVRTVAETSLIKVGDPAISWLSRNFASQPEELRKSMVVLFGKFGQLALPHLSQIVMRDRNSYIRAASASQLGAITPSNPEVVRALMVALNDGEEWVRVEAAQSLGELGAQASMALGPIISAAFSDQDPLVQRRAKDAAEQMKPATDAAFPGLLKAYPNANTEARLMVLEAVKNSSISSTNIQLLLRTALKDSDPAALALAKEIQKSLADRQSTPVAIQKSTTTATSTQEVPSSETPNEAPKQEPPQ